MIKTKKKIKPEPQKASRFHSQFTRDLEQSNILRSHRDAIRKQTRLQEILQANNAPGAK